jgi:hypothetical protein
MKKMDKKSLANLYHEVTRNAPFCVFDNNNVKAFLHSNNERLMVDLPVTNPVRDLPSLFTAIKKEIPNLIKKSDIQSLRNKYAHLVEIQKNALKEMAGDDHPPLTADKLMRLQEIARRVPLDEYLLRFEEDLKTIEKFFPADPIRHEPLKDKEKSRTVEKIKRGTKGVKKGGFKWPREHYAFIREQFQLLQGDPDFSKSLEDRYEEKRIFMLRINRRWPALQGHYLVRMGQCKTYQSYLKLVKKISA